MKSVKDSNGLYLFFRSTEFLGQNQNFMREFFLWIVNNFFPDFCKKNDLHNLYQGFNGIFFSNVNFFIFFFFVCREDDVIGKVSLSRDAIANNKKGQYDFISSLWNLGSF